MDTSSISGPPCPICGETAFAWSPDDDLIVEIGDVHYQPRTCAECGNLLLVLTRVDDLALV